MRHYVIAHAEQEGRYWSLYGWAPVLHAMRFSGDEDAAQFRDSHGLFGHQVRSLEIDDVMRPDLQTDYNPFAPREG
jgi:hypothetical protein